MEGSICRRVLVSPPNSNTTLHGARVAAAHSTLILRNGNDRFVRTVRLKTWTTAAAINGFYAATDPAQVEITWQIVVGALAGVTPFVVAGIEFGKRIRAQRRCELCGGSGLVLRDKKYYFRCPACGGFLPWQSWKRFFSG